VAASPGLALVPGVGIGIGLVHVDPGGEAGLRGPQGRLGGLVVGPGQPQLGPEQLAGQRVQPRRRGHDVVLVAASGQLGQADREG